MAHQHDTDMPVAPPEDVARLLEQLNCRDRQLQEATQSLAAAAAQVEALTAAAAEKDRRLAESARQAADVQQQLGQLRQSLRWLCARVSRRADPLPILHRIRRSLAHLLPPPATAAAFPLLHLPDPALQLVIQKAGPDIRQACKHFREMHGPVAHLAPWQSEGTRHSQLVAALQRPSLLHHLTSLDLSDVLDASKSGALPLLASGCTRLQSLSFAAGESQRPEDLAPLTALASTLTELHLGVLKGATGESMGAFGLLTSLQALRVSYYSHPADAQVIQPLAALLRLSRLEWAACRNTWQAGDFLATAAQLPALVSLTLPASTAWDPPSVRLLATLQALTALSFGVFLPAEAAAGGDAADHEPLLRAVAALRGLRALSLSGLDTWALRHLSCLSALQLQSLDVQSSPYERHQHASVILGAVGPALTRLVLCNGAALQADHLLALSTRACQLRALVLRRVGVPQRLFRLLSLFPHLRHLEMDSAVYRTGPELGAGPPQGADASSQFDGLCGLTQLQSLSIRLAQQFGAQHATRCPAMLVGEVVGQVVALTGLTQLLLSTNKAMFIEDMWGLLPLQQLQELQLPFIFNNRDRAIGDLPRAFAALQHLPRLRRCSLGPRKFSAADMQQYVAACVRHADGEGVEAVGG